VETKKNDGSVPIIRTDDGKNVDNGYEDHDHIIYLDTAFFRKMN
jgi:hypothetical protein